MATKVVMEALSPTMEEGRLVKWLKNEGDAVKTGDILAEVETDKAVMELVARGDGIVRKRLASEGDASPVGTLLAVIAAADENIDALVAGTPKAEATPADAPGAAQAASEPSSAEPSPAPPSSAEEQAAAPAQETAQAPTPPPSSPASPARGSPSSPAPSPHRSAPHPRSSPLARRMASERGVELARLRGSGPGGRIVKKDVESAAAAGTARPGTAGTAVVAPRFISREGDYQDIPLTQIRKTIARRLVESIGPVPTFYLTTELDAGRAAEMRAQLKELGDDYKASFNDIVLKSVASALSDHPEVNAHWMGDHIRHFNRVHVAMAVAVQEGLITPVIFDADRKTLVEISAEARQLAEKARQRKLTPEQYTGATFSVSNLGMLGIAEFTAIINPPEAGILAVGAVEAKPMVVEGQIVVRQRMRVTMSCDHRVIDGATGAKFLQTVRRYFENPLLLVI